MARPVLLLAGREGNLFMTGAASFDLKCPRKALNGEEMDAAVVMLGGERQRIQSKVLFILPLVHFEPTFGSKRR
uniref:Uncharacterized protein n=1 Tax=Knipowitschia caucasica TaxID=637954 RepID=A0AAV2K339_KNICA